MIAATATATTIVNRSFHSICQGAELVFCGTVTAVESRRDGPSDEIHTYTTFAELEWIGGQGHGPEYTLRCLGGTVAGESLTVQGMPHFVIGQRCVVFVRGNGQNVCPLVGWHQGCFRAVQDNGQNDAGVVTYDGKKVLGIYDGDIVTPETALDPKAGPMTFRQFVEHIRTVLAATGDAESPR